MEKFFKLSQKGTNVRTEIAAGITTFMAMAYILMVNPGMFSQLDGLSYGAAYIATAIPAVIGTILIGLMANLPLAQAPGMGLNAFFVYTVCFGLGFSYANALLFVLIDGLMFVLLTVTGLRRLIFDAIPETVKKAVPAGIGLFIAFLGLQSSGLVVPDAATGVNLASMNLLGSATWGSVMPMLITVAAVIAFITSSLAFCMVDMFDTMGTLYGACRTGNMLIKNEKGQDEVPNMNSAMMADALATCTGAVCGTSTVTTFVEASAGVAAGGRTGLSAMVTGALFFVAMFLSPLAALIPSCAYSAALIYVGILMIGCVKDIEWSDPAVALPAFLTLSMMPFAYNVSYGIAFGLVSHVAIKVFTGKIKEVNIGTWVITALFLIMFFLTH